MGWIQASARVKGKFVNPVPTGVGDWKMIFRVLARYLTNREERTPKRPIGPFQTDPRIFDSQPASGLRVTWMGHSSTVLEIDGTRVLIDPVWNERASPTRWAGPKPFFAAPLNLEDLPSIDVVLISHDHYDHLGARTISALSTLPNLAAARWVTSLGVGSILAGFGVDRAKISELDWAESVQVDTLSITSLPARHFSGRSLLNRFETLWSSFALSVPGGHNVYYGADSGEWPGFAEIAERYGPFDLTMLEIGAYDALWSDIHMGPEGALRSFAAMGGSGLLMPVHWGRFDLALHAWRQPIARIFAEPGVKIFAPQPGLPTEVVADSEVRSEWWR
jgi:L-ascorbate metabolism protein UlaG (beta-lactamase superfamily)